MRASRFDSGIAAGGLVVAWVAGCACVLAAVPFARAVQPIVADAVSLAVAAVADTGAAGAPLDPAPAASTSRTLQNGRRIAPYAAWPDDAYNYYGCQDAAIDAAQPLANFGRLADISLAAGASRKVLIRFHDLHRAIGPGKRITNASLTLHTVAGSWTTGNTIRVHRLLAPWRQGGADSTPQPQHWTCSWTYRLYSANAAEALAWAVAGAAGDETDRAASPTVTVSTSTNYSSTLRTWRIDGLTADVVAWHEHNDRNFGWVIEYDDPGAATGSNAFYSSDAVDSSLRPELTILFDNETASPTRAVDLDVTYIARTPEYRRYNPSTYEYKLFHDDWTGVLKNPGYANEQKWPQNGDTVTFTAHVRNKGLTAASGPFAYCWRLNGQVIATGTDPVGIAAGAEATYALPWTWDANDYAGGTDAHRNSTDHRDRVITFEADVDEQIVETSENNNALGVFLEAPCMGIYVEQSMYDMMNAIRNPMGSYSFEAWLNWYFQTWNEVYLEMSRFEGFATDGSLERLRVQKIQVVPDGTLQGGNHIPGGATNYYLDGEWGMLPSQEWADKWTLLVEWGFLHECTHQMGLIDLYTMNMEAGTPTTPLRVKVKDGGNSYIARGYYPPFGGLMGGGDTRFNDAYEPTGLYAAWDVGAFNGNVGYRRGFYGEQLYDLPQTVRLRAVDASGNPLPNAAIRVWQSSGGNTSETNGSGVPYTWQPIVDAVADADGVLTLPNVGTMEAAPFTTLTGHTLRPNPWGRINVVGTNGSLLIKVAAHGQQDYHFQRIDRFNAAYWSGHANEYTYDVPTTIVAGQLGATNLAQGHTASSNVGGGPSAAVDGNVNTAWNPGNVPVNAYLQVDLGAAHDIAKVVLYQNGYGGDFFEKFRIETSSSGTFTGEQSLLVRESVGWGNTSGTRRDMDPLDPEQDALWVTYAGTPRIARYVRITCEQAHWTRLAELRVYGLDAESPPTAHDTSVAVPINGQIDITLSGASAYGRPVATIVTALPAHGAAADPNAGVITAVPYTLAGGANVVRYRPARDYGGDDTFTFRVDDGQPSADATVTIAVGGVQSIAAFPMDIDPGWSTEGQWAFGKPTGGGGQYGRPDPEGGHTGDNVYGYNLDGDYPPNLPATYLTTTPIDCSGYGQVTLRFWRWLGVESSPYDTASVAASANGVNWVTLWQNPTGAPVSDAAWTLQEFDLSAVANGEAAVRVRWTMGPTDSTWNYCGWNIDDVEITGEPASSPADGDFDDDGDSDLADFAVFLACFNGPQRLPAQADCVAPDVDNDLDVDLADFGAFLACFNGPSRPPACMP